MSEKQVLFEAVKKYMFHSGLRVKEVTKLIEDEFAFPQCNACGEIAVGVIPALIGHKYVCGIHAREAESEGLTVDYENWRLDRRMGDQEEK